MEGGGVVSSEETNTTSSYTYWVRETKQDAAPLPVPKKLTKEDISTASNSSSNHLGSAWNKVYLFISFIYLFLKYWIYD